jgi:hypothetical protein
VAPDTWDWGAQEPKEDDRGWGTVNWDEPSLPPDVANRQSSTPAIDRISELTQSSERRETLRAQSLADDGSKESATTSAAGRYLTGGMVGAGIIANLCTLTAFRSVNVTSLQPFSGSITWALIAVGGFVTMAAAAIAALTLAALRKQVRLTLSTVAMVAVLLSVASLVVKSEVARLQRSLEAAYLQDIFVLVERARIWADEFDLTLPSIENVLRGLFG